MISLSYTKHYQFSYSVMSNSLQPHGLQHARLPCPSPTSGACSISCPLVGDAVQPSHLLCSLLLLLQSSPGSGSFPVSQFFASGGQSIGASTSILPKSIQGWFPLRLIDWCDLLAFQGTLKSRLQHPSSKASILRRFAFIVQLSHPYVTMWLLERP